MPKTPENRDATVVYPGTSPKLVLAYRIFGPGLDSLETLAEQKKTIIIKPPGDLAQPGGGRGLTRLGEDLAASMGLDIDEIISAYKTYKKEIKRMNKADRNHLKRKRAQLDGVDTDSPSSSPSSSSSSTTTSSSDSDSDSNSSSSNDQLTPSIEHDSPSSSEAEQQQQQPSPKRNKTLDELLETYLAPDLWLPRDTALTRTKAHRATIEEMHATIGKFIEIYTTRLPYSRPLGQAMHALVDNLMRWRADAARIEKLVTLHDNSTPLSTWKSPDTKNVTYGPKVTQTLHMFWELDGVLGGMRRSLAHCEYLRGRFLAAGSSELRKRFYHELVFNMRRFAALCVIEEVREEFVGGLEEERRLWSPESSPDSEEYKTDFEDFSSDSESEGEEADVGGNQAASDAVEPLQE